MSKLDQLNTESGLFLNPEPSDTIKDNRSWECKNQTDLLDKITRSGGSIKEELMLKLRFCAEEDKKRNKTIRTKKVEKKE